MHAALALTVVLSSVPLAQDDPPPMPGPARIVGRFVDAAGAPVAGVEVAVAGARGAASERGGEWRAPAPVRSNADGTCALRLAPPRGWSITVEASAGGMADLVWKWPAPAAGEAIELGDVPVVPLARLDGRIVDGAGRVLTRGWLVHLEVDRRHTAGARVRARADARPDPDTGEFQVTDLPVGPVALIAHHELGERTQAAVVDTTADDFVELSYAGADLARRLVVWIEAPNGLRWMKPPIQTVRIFGPAGETHTGTRPNQSSARVIFDDLDPGPWTLDVLDERFVPIEREGLRPGTIERVRLEGNAAIVLSVQDDAGAPIGAYGLEVDYRNQSSWSSTHVLQPRGTAPPAEHRFLGMVPGDVVLVVRAAGRPAVEVTVDDLLPDEEREVVVSVPRGVVVEGRVLRPDRVTPASGVRVEAVRGQDVGRDLSGGGQMVSTGQAPAVDAAAVTDSAGRFRFDALGDGEHVVRAVWSRWLTVERRVDVGGEGPPVLEIVEPPSGHLIVDLALPEVATSFGFEVIAIPVGATHDVRAFHMPSAAGRPPFEIGPFPAGDASLWLHVTTMRSGRPMGTVTIPCEPVVVRAGETNELEIDLRERLPAAVRVRVRVDGAVVGGIFPELFEVSDVGQSAIIRLATPDGDGCVLAGVYPPGPCRLRVHANDRSFVWTVPGTIELAPGEERIVEVELEHVRRFVRLVDTDGEPVPAHDLVVHQWEFGDRPRVVTSDARGLLELDLWKGAALLQPAGKHSPIRLDWNDELADVVTVELEKLE